MAYVFQREEMLLMHKFAYSVLQNLSALDQQAVISKHRTLFAFRHLHLEIFTSEIRTPQLLPILLSICHILL